MDFFEGGGVFRRAGGQTSVPSGGAAAREGLSAGSESVFLAAPSPKRAAMRYNSGK